MFERYYDEERGFGDILGYAEGRILVRFDSDPWYLEWIYLSE